MAGDGNGLGLCCVRPGVRRLLVALALVVAACGGSAAPAQEGIGGGATVPSSAPGDTSDATSGTSTTVASDVEPTEAPGTTQQMGRVRPEGPDAPDFALTLGEGGEFSLSAESKPVYMVFWAEW